MIHFNSLQIVRNNNSSSLCIDVSIVDAEYGNNCYLTGIYICNQDTFLKDFTHSTPSWSIELVNHERRYADTIPLNNTVPDLKDSDLFFIFVTWGGTPGESIPCGKDKNPQLGITYDRCFIYQQSMNFFKNLDLSCTGAVNNIDILLNHKYFEILKNRNVYILESNHDIEMLTNGKYPFELRQRILSDKGHISNYDSAKYLSKFIAL